MTVSAGDVNALAASHDVISLGRLADQVRRERHGLRTTFVRIADVTAEPRASLEWSASAGEVRIVGTPVSRAAAVLRVTEVVARARGVPVSAFSLDDLERLAAREIVPLRALLEELREAGLDLIAEAPFHQLRDPRRSIEEVNIAGLVLARLTLSGLPAADMVGVLKQVARLQEVVGVIRVLAPLHRTASHPVPTVGDDDVRDVALARLLVRDVPSIQVDWTLCGPSLAHVALTVGADDIGSVSAKEKTSTGRWRVAFEEVRRAIRKAGQEPVERNGRFEPVGARRSSGRAPSGLPSSP
jgi:hypothetical protein